MLLAASHRGLTGAWFEGQRHGPTQCQWAIEPNHPLLVQACAALDAYFGATHTPATLAHVPIDLSAGTAFQQQVWQALRSIAPGTVTTYSELSASLGCPSSVRAVAAAIGKNPVSIVVPCHRVIGKNGQLVGYAGGLPRKAHLLAHEQGTPHTHHTGHPF